MSIRSRINFTLVISIVLMLFLASFLYINNKKIHTSRQINFLNADIVNKLYEFSNVTTNFFLFTGNAELIVEIDNLENDIKNDVSDIKSLENIPQDLLDELAALGTSEKNINELLAKANEYQDNSSQEQGEELLNQFESELTTFISDSIQLTQANQDYIIEQQNISFVVSLVILMIVAIIYLINSLIINRTIKYPINRFNDAISKISRGDMDTKVIVRENNELGRLARTFNQMLSSIKRQEAEKYDFISTISHQLRTPISSILWTAESIESTKNKNEIATITEKSQDLNSIVDHLLFYLEMTTKQFDKNKYEKIYIPVLMEKIISDRKQMIKNKHLTINYDKSMGKFEVFADRAYLEKAVGFVLDNAISYNRPKGTIFIDIKKIDKHLLLEISDTGYGIPAKDQRHIFDKFFRASNASLGKNEGSGISLYLTKMIIKQFDGTIELESQEDKGTRVDITLPVIKS